MSQNLGIPSRFISYDELDDKVIHLDDLPDVIAFYLEHLASHYPGEEMHEMLTRELLRAEADALRAAVH